MSVATSSKPRLASAEGRAAHILVVDDQRANVEMAAELLRVRGYQVETAVSGEAALERVRVSPPDLVVMDIVMPGLDGYEVCRRLRAREDTALLPIVLVTSLDPNQERVKGMEAGADDFLQKPINQQELFARVKSLLRVKSLQDEVKQQAEKLAEWNAMLEARVKEQVDQLERLGRLKNFFSPQLGEAILAGGGLDRLIFSVDGATKKTFESIRVGAEPRTCASQIQRRRGRRLRVDGPGERRGRLGRTTELQQRLGV